MNNLRKTLMLVFGVIFFISLIMVIRILVQGKMEQAAFDELAAIADDAKYPESGLRADQKTTESSP